jgi:hypothetical protein
VKPEWLAPFRSDVVVSAFIEQSKEAGKQ